MDTNYSKIPERGSAFPVLPVRDLSAVEAYAVRRLAFRSRISPHHAAVAAELAGLTREGRRDG